MTSAGPYRTALYSSIDEERYRLRLDRALSCALRDPRTAFWLALDVLIDTEGRCPMLTAHTLALLGVISDWVGLVEG